MKRLLLIKTANAYDAYRLDGEEELQMLNIQAESICDAWLKASELIKDSAFGPIFEYEEFEYECDNFHAKYDAEKMHHELIFFNGAHISIKFTDERAKITSAHNVSTEQKSLADDFISNLQEIRKINESNKPSFEEMIQIIFDSSYREWLDDYIEEENFWAAKRLIEDVEATKRFIDFEDILHVHADKMKRSEEGEFFKRYLQKRQKANKI